MMEIDKQILLLTLFVWVSADQLETGLVIDVSHHNGQIDWAKVRAAGVTLVIAKATEGATYQDPTFADNWRGIRQHGMQAGAYHYLKGLHSIRGQVENIDRTLQSVNFQPDDMLVIDIEEAGNKFIRKRLITETAKEVLDGLKGEFNNLWIYTGPSYWENRVDWRSHDFSVYKLWIAHYTNKSQPDVPTTWGSKGYSLWQYTDQGRVDGIRGDVDLSRYGAA